MAKKVNPERSLSLDKNCDLPAALHKNRPIFALILNSMPFIELAVVPNFDHLPADNNP
ncbi:hypothetical protein GCM10028818_48100 [Spirosoma horti]